MSRSSFTAASSHNFQLTIGNALKAYEKCTKQDLLTHPLAFELQVCDSPAAVLTVLQQHVEGQDQPRSGDDRRTKWLVPTVKVLHTFSATLEERVGLLFSPANVTFTAVGVFLLAAKDLQGGQDTVFGVFERIESFFERLEGCSEVPPTTEMMDTMVQIMVVTLSILGIATKGIKQGRMKKYAKTLIGRTDLEDALNRLDKITHEQAQMASAELQRATHAVDETVGGVTEQVVPVDDSVVIVNDEIAEVINDGKEAESSPSPNVISTAPIPTAQPLGPNEREQSDSSPTGLATSSTSNVQLIVNALAEYAQKTGMDLSKNSFVIALEQSNSPEAILQLLEERAKAFKEYRDGNRRLINCLSPAVKVIQAFSGILGEAASLVPFPPASAFLLGLIRSLIRVSSSYDALLDLFECLGNFLSRLEIYTRIPPTPTMTDIIVKIMIELLSVLALATKQVEQGRFKKFAQKLLGGSEIEAVLQRLDRLTQDEARMTGAQTLSVVYGLVGSMRAIMEDGKASTDGIRGDLVALHDLLNDMNKMKRNQLQRDVRHWLSPPDPSTNHNFVREARHSGTAAWFFESNSLTEWKGRGSLLWIHGKPGAGKSTLLSAIIQDIEHLHAAGLATLGYYYFDFRDVKKQDCYGLLSSLISQLSSESDSCFNILSQFYSDHGCGMRQPDIGALKKCMTDMLSLPGQAPVYIIVDALDECPNFPGRPSARGRVLEMIEELANLKLRNVHLCVASQPEMDIRIVLEPLTSLKISLHDEKGQKEDIIAYIKYVVRSDRSMRRWKEEDNQLAVDTLSDKADGMFRWVACQVDRLCRTFPASIRSVLNDLPKTLDETYGHTLLSIDEEKREYAQRLFQCLTVSIRPLRVEELAEILAIRFDEAEFPTFNAAWRPENAEEAVMSACSSLIAIVDGQGSQVVQFSHFSVKEYLTSKRLATADERLSYYHILPEPAHTILARAALTVLLQLDDKIDKNTIDHFPLAPYAARYWVDHAQFRSVSSHIQEIMERLFDAAESHFAAWVWLHDIDRHWIEPTSKIHPSRPDALPIYYVSLCGFSGLVGHLVAFRSEDVNSRGGSHTTPLHAASVKGHLFVASLLLENGADPNSCDDRGRTPLHRVSQGGQPVMLESSLEIARFLVNSGAGVNVTDDEGSTPLHAAARSGYRAIAELLLGSGASLEVRNKNQFTPLYEACVNGKLDVSRLLIDRGSDIYCQDNDGYIPLHAASGFGHVDVAWLLLDRGSDMDARNTEYWTPLHFASCHGHLDTARLLIDRNADVNAHEAFRRTPLHLASSCGHLDIAKLLVERGAIVDSQNDKEETPLHFATASGHLDTVRFLIESGAAMSARSNNGWTPFHTASKFGHLHITKFLLDCGIDVDIRNKDEETSLDLASSSGEINVVRFLIEHGADVHTKDNKVWNPLHIASQNGHLDVVRMLTSTGTAVDIRNGTQKTPLALASSKGKVEVGRYLIEQGVDINAKDSQGWAPLHFASRHGHLDMARLLLDRGVDPNIQCGDLSSALHLASANNHLDIADLLVQRGASVDVSNEKQETPLYQAVKNEKIAIVRHLMDQGANVHSAGGNGWTALHAASHSGHLEVVKLLLRRGANVDVLTKANKTAAELASENGKAEIERFIAEYKADAIIRNKIRSTTMDTDQYGVDGDGKASLHAAAEEGNIDAVKSLLNRGVDINGRIAGDRTPLDRAAFNGKVDVVRLLIERGAEVDARDKWGWTPLHHASRFGHLEVSRVLLDRGANVNARQKRQETPLDILLERDADVHARNEEGRTAYQESLVRGYQEIADLLWEYGAGRLGASF